MSRPRGLLAGACMWLWLSAACAGPTLQADRVVSAATQTPPTPAEAPQTTVESAASTPAPAILHPTARPPASTPASSPPARVGVAYRVEVRASGGEDFAALLAETMADPRGWSQAGFVVTEDAEAHYLVVLAEGPEVDELCRPYDTGGRFSCQNGPVVALNADRWRDGVRHWPSGLTSYRQMLLNHEMGHLLGQRHRPCPGGGAPAPVMYQQSGGLGGCKANAWPLPGEIERAARHDLKLAPGYGE